MKPTERELFYYRQGGGEGEPSAKGVRQYRDHQSEGETPADPDRDFEVLEGGKRQWDITLSFIRWSYLKESFWHGTECLRQDFGGSEAAASDIEKSLGMSPGTILVPGNPRPGRPVDGTWCPEGVTEENPFSGVFSPLPDY